jgi:hypothetical protein
VRRNTKNHYRSGFPGAIRMSWPSGQLHEPAFRLGLCCAFALASVIMRGSSQPDTANARGTIQEVTQSALLSLTSRGFNSVVPSS